MDSSACRVTNTSVLEQVHVAPGLAGAQVVTGALSALLVAKEHLGELCSSLSGFVNSGRVYIRTCIARLINNYLVRATVGLKRN